MNAHSTDSSCATLKAHSVDERSAIANIIPILEWLLPGGTVRGQDYVVRNPTRADKAAGSFKVCVAGPKVGVWSDFATNDKGGDPISLVAYIRGCSKEQAGRILRNFLSACTATRGSGIDSSGRLSGRAATSAPTRSAPSPAVVDFETLPAPESAGSILSALARLGKSKPHQHWLYRTADRGPAFYIVRWNNRDGSKTIRPMSWCRSAKGEGWSFRAWPHSRPLYNLPRIFRNPAASILVCEGEGAADAVRALYGPNVVVTTSSGGAGAVAKTDWSPLAGRIVRIWPDADEPGQKYAEDAARRLTELGCDVSVIDAMALASTTPAGQTRPPKDGWDAADAMEEWTDLAALRTTIKSLEKRFDPGPTYVSFGPFEMTAEGLTIRGKSANKGGGDASAEVTRICAPFEVIGESRNPGGRDWGKWIRFGDRDGRVHRRHVPDAHLHGDPAILCGPLAGEGLAISPNQQRLLLSYLAGVRSTRRVTVVQRTGWCHVGGHGYFVLPNETIGPRGAELVILDAGAVGPYESQGTFDDWRNGAAKIVGGHSLAIFAVSGAFAGPLLDLVRTEGFGVHFFGPSSTGKTTIEQAAASVWGRGSLSGGYVRSWRATANGLEAAAASANDTLLVLDELGVLEAREAGAAIYALANGSGKSRMNRDTSPRETRTWRIVTLSTGEIPMATKVAEDRGRKARAGQILRMLDVPADRGVGFGVFTNAGPESSAGVLADKLKVAAMTNFGTAGPEFVRRVIRSGVEKIGAAGRTRINAFVAAKVPEGADGQVRRAAHMFGLLAAAGELATALGVTPWRKGQATNAASWAFRQWIEGRGGVEAAEVRQAIEQVRRFIEQYGDSRFDSLAESGDRPADDRAGWRTGSGVAEEWMIPPETWKAEVCTGLDPKLVARTLSERNMLKSARDGFQSVVKIKGTAKRVYVVTAHIFE
jgi:putative DNA primase/helicase